MPANANKENHPVGFRKVGSPKHKRPREPEDSDSENEAASRLPKKRRGAKYDRLTHHGRHFGRTISTFANMQNLIESGVQRHEQMVGSGASVEDLDDDEREEHELFLALLKCAPGLEARLFNMGRTTTELLYCANMLTRGVSTARADDVKNLKAAVIDFITPSGGVLVPALSRNSKIGRGFHHDVTGRYLCPTDYDWNDPQVREGLRIGTLVVTGLQWPCFLYTNNKCDPDNMWEGLLKGRILLQAYKHVFTSPSSVEGQIKATRSGNAQLHGMTAVTIPSIVYIATLVRFSLSSAGSFSRTDTTTDSERFYNTLLEFLESPEEAEQVEELLAWWNPRVFPATNSMLGNVSVPKTSALARLHAERERRAALVEMTNAGASGQTQ